MSLTAALSSLYAASGVVSCLCYGPQLVRLWRSAEARRAMALPSWAGWLCLSGITLLYATMVVGQPEMIFVSGANVACQAAVVTLVTAQRFRDGAAGRNTKRAGRCRIPTVLLGR